MVLGNLGDRSLLTEYDCGLREVRKRRERMTSTTSASRLENRRAQEKRRRGQTSPNWEPRPSVGSNQRRRSLVDHRQSGVFAVTLQPQASRLASSPPACHFIHSFPLPQAHLQEGVVCSIRVSLGPLSCALWPVAAHLETSSGAGPLHTRWVRVKGLRSTQAPYHN